MTGGVGMVSSWYYVWEVVLVWSLGGNICDHWGLYGQQVVIPVISGVSMVCRWQLIDCNTPFSLSFFYAVRVGA